MITTFGEFLNAKRDEQYEVFKKIKRVKPDKWFGTYIPHNIEYKDECPYGAASIFVWHEKITDWKGCTILGDEVEAILETGRTTLLLIGFGGIEAEIVIKYKRASEYSCFSYDGIQQPVFEYYGRGFDDKDRILGNKYKWFFERLNEK